MAALARLFIGLGLIVMASGFTFGRTGSCRRGLASSGATKIETETLTQRILEAIPLEEEAGKFPSVLTCVLSPS